jgi:hypothetical protein
MSLVRTAYVNSSEIEPKGSDRLESWKEFVAHLGRTEKTAQRWAQTEGRAADERLVGYYTPNVDTMWKPLLAHPQFQQLLRLCALRTLSRNKHHPPRLRRLNIMTTI